MSEKKDIKSFIECYFSSSLVIAAKISLTRAQPSRRASSAPSSPQQLRAGLVSAVFIPFDTPARGAALQVDPGVLLVGDHSTVGVVP